MRPPADRELRATSVLAIPIDEASAKVRSGENLEIPCWAGEIPLRLTAFAPVADPRLAFAIDPPLRKRRR